MRWVSDVSALKYLRGEVTTVLVPAEGARTLCTLTGIDKLVTDAVGGGA